MKAIASLLLPLALRVSPQMLHSSPLVLHLSPLKEHLSPLEKHLSPQMLHLSPLEEHLSPLALHLSPLKERLQRRGRPKSRKGCSNPPTKGEQTGHSQWLSRMQRCFRAEGHVRNEKTRWP